MGRKKFDINVRPSKFVNGCYEVRFTNADAINDMITECVIRNIYKPNVSVFKLNKWRGITKAEYEVIRYGLWSYNYDVKISEDATFD